MTIHNFRGWFLTMLASAACALVYAPGLYGSFVFDDSTFILANSAMHVTTLKLGAWVAAALSFPSGHQGRWLGMLSFAVNHYFTGLDPFWLKLTNLAIHLLNGILLFLLLRALFALWRECRPDAAGRRTFDKELAAATLAALWMVLPINLTAVLYVSQRLESLSTLFVFGGLWWYLRARLAHWQGRRSSVGLWASLIVSTGLGVLVKESAVMLPLYALCVEVTVAQARTNDGQRSRSVLALFSVLIGAPLLIGMIWLGTWIGGATSYARPFDTVQRLMTEARVLTDYIQWTLLPRADSLTLFHDDIVVSRGLFAPPSTFFAIGGLLLLFGVAVWQRTRRPLFALGVLWFFAGHLLTGTVIPLMLAFEHRNYFPSVGLLLAAGSLVALEGGMQRMRGVVAGCLFLFYALTTWMRAEEWSDPLRLALSDANKRPDSSAAQYELGRVLLSAHRKGDLEPMTSEAFQVLERGSRIPNSDILHEQLLIVSHAQLKQPIDPAWWNSLIEKLRSRPPTTADIGGLMELQKCFEDHVCPDTLNELGLAFSAAVAHPSPNGVLLSAYGQFAEKDLHDSALAEKQFRAALATAPGEATTHTNLITFLVHHGRFDEAQKEIDRLQTMNHFGSLEPSVRAVEQLLRDARRAQQGPSGSIGPAAAESATGRPPNG